MRFTADEIKEAWDTSPRIAKNQAARAVPIIEKEISDLKCELEVINDILDRELEAPSSPGPSDADSSQDFARGDDDADGGIGSQQAEPAEAKA